MDFQPNTLCEFFVSLSSLYQSPSIADWKAFISHVRIMLQSKYRFRKVFSSSNGVIVLLHSP